MTGLSLRNESPGPLSPCAAPGCPNLIKPAATGRPARYCGDTCRVRAYRQRPRPVPAIAEVLMGSATSRDRHPDTAWLTQLRRGEHTVILATGLRRRDADRLADQVNELLARPDP